MTETPDTEKLEAQIAELKQEKERLLGLLEKALTALNRQEEREPKRIPTPQSPGSKPMAARTPPEEFTPGTWAWLKNWFLNA